MQLYKSKNWIRKSCPGLTESIKAKLLIGFFALAWFAVLAAPSAWAHTDPPNANANGVGILLTAFRNDGVTRVADTGNTVSQCETIQYRAALFWGGVVEGDINSAFEGGDWSITTPDGVVHALTPPDIGCIGGTVDDPNMAGGRGDCDPTELSVASTLIEYTVNMGDIVGGIIQASTTLDNAFSHAGVNDLALLSASAPYSLAVDTCDNGLFCDGTESCDPALVFGDIDYGLGACIPGTPPVCDDNDQCTSDFCDEALDACGSSDISGQCDPGDACSVPFCDPATGCGLTDISGQCDQGDACNTPFCDPVDGCGLTDISGQCDPGDACNTPFCDPVDGCGLTDISDQCDPGDACNTPFCDPTTGCGLTDISDECAPGNACETPFCDPVNGCGLTDISDQCDPGDACNTPFCDPITGCGLTDISDSCDDNDPCTADSCDPVTGCTHTPIESSECSVVEICRTPGFWATHGGDDKDGSQNITQMVIDGSVSGYLSVCGNQIATTDPAVMWSTSNAMCTAVKGVKERQLVRQLTAMTLNCVMSGGDGDCSNTSVQGLADECNAICGGGAGTGRSINDCIAEIDCFNNGGAWDGNSCLAYVGMCSSSGADCDSNTSCPEVGEVCNREPDCHSMALCQDNGELCFTPPGPAGGVNDCKLAKKNGNYLPY